MEINIREKTEIKQSSRSPSPEVTHTIKIAMKYIGQPGLAHSDNKNTKINYDESSISCVDNNQNNYQEFGKKNNECCGVNVALDFTLNCNNFQLTQRDVSLKAMSKN
ncbi:uncharacterized protein LOC122858953 [Aphidius gifuensis]|nr:uncharacterized protein LOC122858953 [Aphidius gifuensis]